MWDKVNMVGIVTRTISVMSKGESDIIDITDESAASIQETEVQNGVIIIFVSGSTAAVTTIENEPGLKKDFSRVLSKLAPDNIEYEHDKAWHDGNGRSHVRASLVGPSLTVPFKDGKLLLGTWQQIVLVEMDTIPRDRKVILQIIGD